MAPAHRHRRRSRSSSTVATGSRAELGGVPSVDTWVQWALTLDDVDEGDHILQVRAVGKDGETQTSVVRAPDPDGSTGLHTIEFSAG